MHIIFLFFSLAVFVLSGCAVLQPFEPEDTWSLAKSSVATFPVATFSPSETLHSVAQESPTAPPTLISVTADVQVYPTIAPLPAEETRLEARYWREWPVVPGFSSYARQILHMAKQNQTHDVASFSKVGDCQMVSGTFLGGYARGQYPIPAGREKTVLWFSESMVRDSVTSYVGLGVNSVLNPLFAYAAGYKECEPKETPIACELRLARPVAVLIAMGTNWKPNSEMSFEKHLRMLVEQILDSGSLPILSTKADNVELDWKLNLAIAKVSYDYDIPLVNIWRSVQDLPDRGLMPPPKDTYLSPDGWMRRNRAWLDTLHQLHLILIVDE